MTIHEITTKNKKLLFTPGPLTTSSSVKEAALFDLGSRDSEFIETVMQIRKKLLNLAHVEAPEYEAVIIQGSGTFGIESVISSAIPFYGTLLNIINGAYGRRISQIAKIHSIPLIELVYPENQLPDIKQIEYTLIENPQITHIAIVHCETTTGIINPISEVGKISAQYKKTYMVDAMSSFGALDINMKKTGISYLVSSSNKCIEGIPGFSFVLVKSSELEKCKGKARTLCLDLYDQWHGLNLNGQFRFTPPVQSLLAFNRALEELEEEGGIEARSERYYMNNILLVKGMKDLGFELYLSSGNAGFIITSFLYPSHPNFVFELFYLKLAQRGCIIYPGKLSQVDCFRIGNIGQLFPYDIICLVNTIGEVMEEMDVELNTKNEFQYDEYAN